MNIQGMYSKEFTEFDQAAVEREWDRQADQAFFDDLIEEVGYDREDIQFMADIMALQDEDGTPLSMIEFAGHEWAILARLVGGDEMRVFPRDSVPKDEYIGVKPRRRPIKLYEIEGVFNDVKALLEEMEI